VRGDENWFLVLNQILIPQQCETKGDVMKSIMKSRIVTVALMASSLFGFTVSTQARGDKSKLGEVVLQDDHSGSFLFIDLKTGEYKFRDCGSDFTMGGFLKVNFSGCAASVSDESDGRLVVANIDLCGGGGRAYIVTEANDHVFGATPPTREYIINDSNIRDSFAVCKPAEK
jgi:hypothetical protein